MARSTNHPTFILIGWTIIAKIDLRAILVERLYADVVRLRLLCFRSPVFFFFLSFFLCPACGYGRYSRSCLGQQQKKKKKKVKSKRCLTHRASRSRSNGWITNDRTDLIARHRTKLHIIQLIALIQCIKHRLILSFIIDSDSETETLLTAGPSVPTARVRVRVWYTYVFRILLYPCSPTWSLEPKDSKS